MSQYTVVYCDQQGLGYREIVLRYKICIVTKGREAAGLCRDTGSRHDHAGPRHSVGAGRAGRGAGRAGAQACGTGGTGARHSAQGLARGAAICQPGAATRLGGSAMTRRQCAPGRAGWAMCAHCALDQF